MKMEKFNENSLQEVKDKLSKGISLKKILGPNIYFSNIEVDVVSIGIGQQLISSGELIIRTDKYGRYMSRYGVAVFDTINLNDIKGTIEKVNTLAYKDAEEKLLKAIAELSTDEDNQDRLPFDTTASEFILNVKGIGSRAENHIQVLAACLDGRNVLVISEEKQVIKWLTKIKAGTQISIGGSYEGKQGDRLIVRAKSLINIEEQVTA
jgi:hypothetical protein